MDDEIRPARPGDLPGLPEIERSGERMFAEIGIVFPAGPTVIEALEGEDVEILVAGDPPVGFAAFAELDGTAYLEQISVRDDLTGRGIGSRLLGAVRERAAEEGLSGTTLLTFRDVPWNGPWYAARGFEELPPARWGPGIRAHWDAEVRAGLHRLGPRCVMRAPTPPKS